MPGDRLPSRVHPLITRSRQRLLSGVVVAALGVTFVGVAPAAPASADIATQIKDSQAQLDRINSAAEAAAERYNAGRIQLAEAQRLATTAQQAAAREDQAVAALRSQAGAFAAQAYKAGAAGLEARLLSGSTPGELLDQLGTLNRISRSQSDVMAVLATARHRQAAAAQVAASTLDVARATVRSLNKDKADVEAAAAKAQQILIGLQAKQQQLIQAARDAASRRAAQARAAELAAQARAEAAAASAFRAQPVAVEQPARAAQYTHYSGSAAEIAVKVAMDQLGKPYQWGAAGPDSFDCSGLTMFAYARAGISLPHLAASQFNEGRHVSRAELLPGDLVFFEKNLGHMGMYIGNGNFIHAPHTGDVVKISPLAGYYDNEWAGAVRLAG